jgi:hypothetical protein
MPYLVFWLIDSDDESPYDAALMAQRAQLPDDDGYTSATVFDVVDKDSGAAWRVDLEKNSIQTLPAHYAKRLHDFHKEGVV